MRGAHGAVPRQRLLPLRVPPAQDPARTQPAVDHQPQPSTVLFVLNTPVLSVQDVSDHVTLLFLNNSLPCINTLDLFMQFIFQFQCFIKIGIVSILLLQDVSSKYVLVEIETSPNAQSKIRYVARVDDMNDIGHVTRDHDENVPQDKDDKNMDAAAPHVQLVNRI